MLHQQERHLPLAVHRPEPVGDVGHERGVDARGGLVEQYQPRLAHERHADLQQAALAAREPPRGLVAQPPQQQEVQQLVDPAAGGGIGAGEQLRHSQFSPLDAEVHVLGHRQVPVDADHLEGARHAQAGHVVGAVAAYVGTAELDQAAVDVEHPGEAIEQRGLAAAVGADEADHLAGADADVHAGHGSQPAETLHHAAGLQQRRHDAASASPPAAGPRRSPRPSSLQPFQPHSSNRDVPRRSTRPTRPRGTNSTITISSTPCASRCASSRCVQSSSRTQYSAAAPSTGPATVPRPPSIVPMTASMVRTSTKAMSGSTKVFW